MALIEKLFELVLAAWAISAWKLQVGRSSAVITILPTLTDGGNDQVTDREGWEKKREKIKGRSLYSMESFCLCCQMKKDTCSVLSPSFCIIMLAKIFIEFIVSNSSSLSQFHLQVLLEVLKVREASLGPKLSENWRNFCLFFFFFHLS